MSHYALVKMLLWQSIALPSPLEIQKENLLFPEFLNEKSKKPETSKKDFEILECEVQVQFLCTGMKLREKMNMLM